MLFASCTTNRTYLKVSEKLLKEIWEGDPCGYYGNRRGIAHLLVDACENDKLSITKLNDILGKPSKIDTLENSKIKYSYIVSAGTRRCDTIPYNDVVHIGMIIVLDLKSNKIISCQQNLY